MVSLTAKQQETLDLLKSKKYDEIKQAMVTRLINRIQTDENKIEEIMPIVEPYLEEKGISPKKILSKLKDPEDMQVYFSTMKKEQKKRNNIDTSKPLLDVLDEINDTVPSDTPVDDEKRMKEGKEYAKGLIPKKRADDSQMAKKRPSYIGGDKGRPPTNIGEITNTIPEDSIIDSEKRMKEGKEYAKGLIPKQRADDSQMAKKRLGGDKGRPPMKRTNKLKAMASPQFVDAPDYEIDSGVDRRNRAKNPLVPRNQPDYFEEYYPQKGGTKADPFKPQQPDYFEPYYPQKGPKPKPEQPDYFEPYYPQKGGKKPEQPDYFEPYYPQKGRGKPKADPTINPRGKDMPIGFDPYYPEKDKIKEPEKERFPGEGRTLGDITKLTDEDKKKQKPVDKQSWINRKDPGRDIKKEPLTKEEEKGYGSYFDAAKAAFYSFREEYDKLQEEIAETNKLIESGQLAEGQMLTDANDPLHMLRALGYTNTAQIDRPGAVAQFYHHAGEIAGNAAQAFFGGDNDFAKGVGDGVKFLGDVMGSFGEWANELARRRDYEWGRNTMAEIESYDHPPPEGVIGINSGTRGDPFYQPKWKYTDYLPTMYDQYGNVNFNGFLQNMYLKPLNDYAGLLENGTPEFIDSMTPEQKKFLQDLKATTVKIRMGNLNITHEQYKKLIGIMVNTFTPEQRNAYLQTQEEALLKDVNDVYNYGKDDTPGKIAGGAIPFKDYIINGITKEVKGGGKTAVDIDDDVDADVDIDDDADVDADVDIDVDEREEKDDEKKEDRYPDKPDEPDEPDKPGKPGKPGKPEEPKPADFRTFDTTKPTYRPRGAWGGTDDLFKITPEEAQSRNLVWESMTLNSGEDRTSQTWKWNQHKYKQRYGKTFKMSRPRKQPSRRVSGRYIAQNQPVWNPQYPDNRRQFYQDTRDPYAYGQFNQWTTRDNIVNPVSMGARMEQPMYYPEYQNKATQGGYVVKPQISSGDLAKQMMMNSRFVR